MFYSEESVRDCTQQTGRNSVNAEGAHWEDEGGGKFLFVPS